MPRLSYRLMPAFAVAALLSACSPVTPPETAAARSATAATAVEPGGSLFDTRKDAGFGDARAALTRYLARQAGAKGRQNFCVTGYVSAAGNKSALVHWREGRKLILWEGRGEDGYPDDSIALSRSQLDLDRDVVATEAEIAGSTYLVTRAWADGAIADCAANGARYQLDAR